jgi:hypothetical protein
MLGTGMRLLAKRTWKGSGTVVMTRSASVDEFIGNAFRWQAGPRTLR